MIVQTRSRIWDPRCFWKTLQSLFSNPTFSNPFRLCLSGGNTIENPEDNCLRHQCSANLVLAQGQFAAFATAHWMLRALPGKTEPQKSPRICSKSLGYQGILLGNGLPWVFIWHKHCPQGCHKFTVVAFAGGVVGDCQQFDDRAKSKTPMSRCWRSHLSHEWPWF